MIRWCNKIYTALWVREIYFLGIPRIPHTSKYSSDMPLSKIRDAVTSLYASSAVDSKPRVDDSSARRDQTVEKPQITTENVPSYRSHPSLNPVHTRFTTSPLSTAEVAGAADEAKVDFRGILNLFFIILFVLNVRLIVENMIRYGSLMQMPRINLFDSPLIFLGYVLVLSLPYLSFVCERYIASSNRSLAHFIQTVLILGTLVGPYFIVLHYPSVHPLRSLLLLMASMVYAMKIGSYWHVCTDLWELKRDGNKLSKLSPSDKSPIESEIVQQSQCYPECLTITQMYMFVAYPTLVFQLAYPRTESVRVRIVLRYAIELAFCLVLQFILIEQYITPLLNNTIRGTEERIAAKESVYNMSWFLLERFLKLVIPNLYIWLLMFAELFHCYLNILAELTRFGDRKFYHDWWNAVSIRDYWQKWNQPVHHWLLRHLYKPFRKLGLNQKNSALFVFIISGIVHEYLIITPIGIPWNGFVTLGFVLQLPLISLTDTQFVRDRPTIGNCLFWITSCFTGQPLATLLYFVAASSPTIFGRLIGWAQETVLGVSMSSGVHDEF